MTSFIRNMTTGILLSRFCKLVLWLMPLLMVYGHVRAIGWTWNHATHAKFSPVTNYVSDYAYRSPAWWAIVACIYGFAFVLGYISWNAAKRPRTTVSWLVVAASAIAMFKLTEVAFYPVKYPEVTQVRLQEELGKSVLEKSREDLWRVWMKVRGKPIPPGVNVDEYLKTHQSDLLHLGGIKPAWLLIVVTMVGSFFMWRSGASSPRRWRLIHGLIVGLLVASTLGASWRFEWVGLFQRISFVAVYIWMWLIVLAIDREGRASGTR
jgi:hypothetical protein